MAKTKYTVTTAWAQVATGAAIFTVEVEGDGALYFNESETDDTAYKSVPSAGDQFEQTAALPTYVRATGTGWAIVADGETA